MNLTNKQNAILNKNLIKKMPLINFEHNTINNTNNNPKKANTHNKNKSTLEVESQIIPKILYNFKYNNNNDCNVTNNQRRNKSFDYKRMKSYKTITNEGENDFEQFQQFDYNENKSNSFNNKNMNNKDLSYINDITETSYYEQIKKESIETIVRLECASNEMKNKEDSFHLSKKSKIKMIDNIIDKFLNLKTLILKEDQEQEDLLKQSSM